MTTHADTFFTDGCGRCPNGGTPDCKIHQWQAELTLLREIILECGLTETCKWGVPCYLFQDSNVALMGVLKAYCFVGFFKGALLADPHGVLFQKTENVQASRLIRFTSIQEVIAQKEVLQAYLFEAIEIEKAGLQVPLKTTSEYPVPEELEQKMAEMPALKSAFEALTPGRQRGYLLHFSAPKQSKTRMERIEKCMPLIFMGKGLHDDYVQKIRKPRAS